MGGLAATSADALLVQLFDDHWALVQCFPAATPDLENALCRTALQSACVEEIFEKMLSVLSVVYRWRDEQDLAQMGYTGSQKVETAVCSVIACLFNLTRLMRAIRQTRKVLQPCRDRHS